MTFNIPESLSLDNIDDLQKGIQNYVVSPAVNLGFAGFIFSKEGNTSINRKASITSNPIEDNTQIQDNIAIEPLTIDLTGYVGELEYKVVQETNKTIQKITETVSIANSFLPKISKQLKQTKNFLKKRKKQTKGNLLSDISQGADIYKTLKELNTPKTKQAKAYNFFNSLFEARQTVSLQTPWRFIPNLAIESISATQGESTDSVTDFSITLKEIKIAGENIRQVEKAKTGHKPNVADTVNKGKTKGKERNVSFIKKQLSKLF